MRSKTISVWRDPSRSWFWPLDLNLLINNDNARSSVGPPFGTMRWRRFILEKNCWWDVREYNFLYTTNTLVMIWAVNEKNQWSLSAVIHPNKTDRMVTENDKRWRERTGKRLIQNNSNKESKITLSKCCVNKKCDILPFISKYLAISPFIV